MKKQLLIGLSVVTLLTMSSMTAFAEGTVVTQDGLLTIELPEGNWYQIKSEENTEMFSDGNCAILVNLYKNGDTLPAIQAADDNHEMIYTAAASTKEYILHVVGYANHQSDFSGICKAINTIKVDNTKITDSMLNHAIATEKYGIAEMNYTAYVAADELNVRDTSEDGSIIATLVLGDKVTVTGSILKNSVEIGWSRIKMADGTEGYVSSQFLSVMATGNTTAPETDQKAEKTGATIVLYDANNNALTLYVYTDGSARTDDGKVYWKNADCNFVDGNGNTLYQYQNSGNGNWYRTGNVRTVYNDNGVAFAIYEYSDGIYYDDAYNNYVGSPDSDIMLVNGGEWIAYSGDPTIGTNTTFEAFHGLELRDQYDNIINITDYDETTGTYYSSDGVAYYRYNAWGAYIDEYGNMCYN